MRISDWSSDVCSSDLNPELKVPEGSVVAINVINGDGAMHDVAVPAFNAQSDNLVGVGLATTIVFRANKAGTFAYVCTVPSPKPPGLFGKMVVDNVREGTRTWVDVDTERHGVSEPVGAHNKRHT